MNDTVSFFSNPEKMRIGDIADACGCALRDGDDADRIIETVGPVEAASKGCLTFLNNPKYIDALASTNASAVICTAKQADLVSKAVVVLVATHPYKAFADAVALMYPEGMRPQTIMGSDGISPAAHVHETAKLEPNVTIEVGAVIGANVQIGSGTHIGPNVVIGSNVSIGRDCSISANASLSHCVLGNNVIVHPGTCIGSDGFGYVMGATHQKIPQVGRVIIQDDVEMGANCCIDRGANRDTIIGEGTKIDNLVQIAHNVVIGRHCVIAGQVGFAGSAELGDYVALGGKTAVNGHTKIGSGAQIGGLSGVFEDVAPGEKLGGVPARPIHHWLRELARIKLEARRKKKESPS